MKDGIRLFVAATLPSSLKDLLEGQLQHYSHPNIRVLPRQNLHLTLYFIGNVPRQQLAHIQQQTALIAKKHASFTLTFEQTEPGPKPKHPRLIWARFAAHPAFEALSQDLTRALSEHPPKTQKSIPHVTLARFRKDQKAPQNLPTISEDEPLYLPVQEISLWQSVLGSPHPTYSILNSYALA
ncbi:RNA 2',3'-cyclic phosphodiesterase [Pontibacter oryzae]|uniref:RNA 2',3'-cyclic phosphodiesterase n=1 Tax=Pontibacter oryzae TaxID=2304593 RepID=A0A399SFB8_9BACT|nr:RNA 2',3'-cyclic phosphodiesterase [Pontibacter oryzae]RIJ42826.1 RNA 2',3'-cyclic phosphodiesterase [Pontibacter oryzae]